MRTVFFSFLLLLAILGSLFVYSSYLTHQSDALISEVDGLLSATRAEDFGAVKSKMEDFTKSWEKASPRLALFTDHSTLDDIMLEASEAKGYAETADGPELLASLETLRSLISHIPKREALSLYNIF